MNDRADFRGWGGLRLNKSFLLGLVCSILAVGSLHAGGWSWTLPPNYVNPASTKRNHVFYVGEPVRFTLAKPGARFEVRDYYGTMVAEGALAGAAPQVLSLGVSQPGWYKLYIYGVVDQGEPWKQIIGGTTFVIFRNDANFPALPAASAAGGTYYSFNNATRAITGMGPQRLFVDDASKPDEAIAKLEKDIAIEKALYLPFDPLRRRALMVGFPNGTNGGEASKIAGVKKIVEYFKNDVQYWEGMNEPDQGKTALFAATTEQKPFYTAVKSVSPSLKVMGPANTTLKSLPWMDTFLEYARGNFDVYSFHAYNAVNGDLWLARKSLSDLQGVLKKNGIEGIEKWQTEQGYFAALYGSYQPRLQGRWTMMQMMVFEQFGIPKEHNHYWYDKSHGFWDFPTWWENEDGGLNPAAVLMRVWSEELWGKNYARAYAFGAEDNRVIGSLFSGPEKSVAVFMTAGNPYGTVTLAVTGASTLSVASPFGVVSEIPVVAGRAQLPVGELPVYVRLAEGQTCEVAPRAYGENIARRAGVSFAVNGVADPTAAKLVNGVMETWYYDFSPTYTPWAATPQEFPVMLQMNLPTEELVSDLVIHATVPWQGDCTLLDYELQYLSDDKWVTIEHVVEPTKTYKVYTPAVRCTVDSFFSDRCVFEHHFAPLKMSKLRLVINNVTFGGGATAEVLAAGGQADSQRVVLREIELFKALATASQAPSDVRIYRTVGSN